MAQLQRTLAAAQGQFVAMGGATSAAAAPIQAYIADIQAQIAAMSQSAASSRSSAAASQAVGAAAAEAAAGLVQLGEGFSVSNVTVAEAIEAQMNWERGVLSAADSAKVFQSTLETMGLSMVETTAETNALAEANARLGSGLTLLSGQSLQGVINSSLGVTSSFSSARQSASTFTSAISEIETSLEGFKDGESVATAGLSELQLQFAAANGLIRQSASASEEAAAAFVRVAPAVEAENFALGTNKASVREIIVLMRELITGNLSRMPGSLMVLAERFGGLATAMMGWVAAAGIAAFAADETYEHFEKIAEAMHSAQAAMALYNPSIATDATQQLVDQLEKVPGMTAQMAGEGVANLGRMQGGTDAIMRDMIDHVQQFSEATGTKVPDALKTMADAYQNPETAGREFLTSLGASQAQIDLFDSTLANQGPAQARAVMLQTMDQNLDAMRQRMDEATVSSLRLNQTMMVFRGGANYVAAVNAAREQAAAMQDEAAAAKDAAASVVTLNKPQSSGDWAQQQTVALDALNSKVLASATNWKTAEANEERTDIAFWQGVISRGNLSTEQLATAKERLFSAQQSLDEQTLTSSTASANQGTREQIAALDAQEAAARGNAGEIEQIEQQKLQVLAAAYGENSAQYQEELARQTEMTKQAAAQQTASMKTELAAQVQLDRNAADEYRSGLQAQVSAGTITREEMLEEYKNFIEQQNDAQLQSVDTLISSLSQGTAAYNAALKERAALYAQFQKTSDALDAQITAAATISANKQSAVYSQVFSQIGNTARAQLNQVILLNETFGQAAEKVYGSVLTSFVGMAETMLARWTATMVAQTVLTQTNMAQQVAAQQAAGSSGWGAILQAMLRYVGLQSATNSQTLAQTAVTSLGQVHAASGVAAANAYASTAAIPMVGPELAPAAAATAMAAVDAYAGAASLAVGAWNLPKDMPANLHAGEMVVPSNFASGLRNSMSLGGVPSTTNISYSPTVSATGGLQASDVQSMLNSQKAEMVVYFQNMFRNGNLMLPGRV
jgi:hypothetical protein